MLTLEQEVDLTDKLDDLGYTDGEIEDIVAAVRSVLGGTGV